MSMYIKPTSTANAVLVHSTVDSNGTVFSVKIVNNAIQTRFGLTTSTSNLKITPNVWSFLQAELVAGNFKLILNGQATSRFFAAKPLELKFSDCSVGGASGQPGFTGYMDQFELAGQAVGAPLPKPPTNSVPTNHSARAAQVSGFAAVMVMVAAILSV